MGNNIGLWIVQINLRQTLEGFLYNVTDATYDKTASDMLFTGQLCRAAQEPSYDQADKVSFSHPDWGPINLFQLLWRGGSPRLHSKSRRARQVSLAEVPSTFLIQVSA